MNRQQNGKLVTVSINGVKIQINPSSIDKESRVIHRGILDGVEVNSPATCSIGEPVILWPEAGKPFAMAIGRAELTILAVQFLQAEGYTVTNHGRHRQPLETT